MQESIGHLALKLFLAVQQPIACRRGGRVQDCVQKTINRMELKLGNSPRMIQHVEWMLHSSNREVRQRAALALARLAPTAVLKRLFVSRQGLDVLLGMLTDEVGEHAAGHADRHGLQPQHGLCKKRPISCFLVRQPD